MSLSIDLISYLKQAQNNDNHTLFERLYHSEIVINYP